MTEVFFRGFGEWYEIVSDGDPSFSNPPDVTPHSYCKLCIGVFKLSKEDDITYKQIGSLENINYLYPSLLHQDSHFKREKLDQYGSNPNDFSFRIETSKEMKLVLAKDVEIKTQDKMELSETEREKLLKQIGVLAILLSKKSNTLGTSTGKPNVSQIAEAVLVELDTMHDANRKGLSNSNLRASISEGLELLNK